MLVCVYLFLIASNHLLEVLPQKLRISEVYRETSNRPAVVDGPEIV